MQLLEIRLDNFKSHEHSVVPIKRGRNAICGQNYAGKTSLLQAIGLTLFGYCDGRARDYIREGTKAATICVMLKLNDGRTCAVRRRLTTPNGSGPWTVTDTENGQQVASGVEDVEAFLCAAMLLPKETDLKELFKNVVGVPQGEMVSAFLDTEAVRRSRFNPLLRTDEYQTAFKELLSLERLAETNMHNSKTEVARFEGELSRLPLMVEQEKSHKAAINNLEEQASQREAEIVLRDKEVQQHQLSESRAKVARIKFSRARARLERLAARHSTLSLNRDEALHATKVLDSNKDEYLRHIAANVKLESLKNSGKEVALLQVQLSKGQMQLARYQASLYEIQGKLDKTTHYQRELERLRPLSAEQNRLDSMLEEANRSLAEASAESNSARKARGQSLNGLCPFLKETCKNIETSNGNLLQYFDSQIADAEKRLGDAQATKRDITDQLLSLGKSPNDPKSLAERYRSLMGDEAHLLAEQDTLQINVQEAENQVNEIQDRINDFAVVQEATNKLLEEVAGSRDAHRAYVANELLAGKYTDYARRAMQLKHLKERAALVADERSGRKSVSESEYDGAAHGTLNHVLHTLRLEQNADQATVAEKRVQLQGIQAEIGEMRSKEHELAVAKQDLEYRREILQHAQTIRAVIKDAGPLINETITRSITETAEQLYGELIGDKAAELEWSSDYAVTLRKDGYERGLATAAGSERVAAAIAIRLALMKHLGGLRVAFLDEPTTHLDDMRRDNLVRSLSGLQFFTQLFVISHDDTFERDTDHVIRLELDGNRSIVQTM